MNEFSLELRHDGQCWFLDVSNRDGESAQVSISYEDKEELDGLGVPYFGER